MDFGNNIKLTGNDFFKLEQGKFPIKSVKENCGLKM